MKRYLVQTMGCQMNVHDSRRIEEVLAADGWRPTDEPALADLVVFNTCSVREKAEHKLMSALGTVRGLKEARRGVVIAVAGCVAQQEGERLLQKARFVDVVIGPDHVAELPALVARARGGAAPVARTVFDVHAPAFLDATPSPERLEVSAFVTVMKGCDERCTYCVVPYTRGPERYRPADAIVGEIRAMVEGGVREVTLLGQTVNSWIEPRPGATPADAPPRWSARLARTSEFAALLRRVAREVPDLARLRYTSPHPRHLTDALIEAHAELDVLARHVHLPVQSGSNRVLRRMLRRYTRELYLERVARLREAVPGLTLSTDIIVGFPGETDADLDETLSLVREAGFVAAFAFKYSPRPNTPSRALADDVPEDVKSARLDAVFDAVGATQRAHLASLVGTTQEVLVEGPSRTDPSRWTGRTRRNEIVHVEGADLAGAILDVVIERANDHSLMGRIARTARPAAPPAPHRLRVLA
ncbi:MAG: tRNA (N6-isopentenyl adenosine(37)-C2)-methylthiotransferase MiaB [Sandaracinaceae bacterium]|nr:tRNA (N6-isopentenyl adenosine(37)-C2)-methylthiotransferase MiaB [Sandaracinaceae bacterium]